MHLSSQSSICRKGNKMTGPADPTTKQSRIEAISAELLSVRGSGQQIVPFSRRYAGFDLVEAYSIVDAVRQLRERTGQRAIGRKVGFTNKAVWGSLGLASPIWNYVYDCSIVDGSSATADFALKGLPEARIEPEVVLHLCAEPETHMSDQELLACVDWIAPAFEIVSSIFPGWEFSAADATAAFGLHAGLVLGAKLRVDSMGANAMSSLSRFGVQLKCDADSIRGRAHDILGGPLSTLRYLIDDIARYPECETLRSGELVATGTLTKAMPAQPGATWNASFSGIGLQPVRVTFM